MSLGFSRAMACFWVSRDWICCCTSATWECCCCCGGAYIGVGFGGNSKAGAGANLGANCCWEGGLCCCDDGRETVGCVSRQIRNQLQHHIYTRRREREREKTFLKRRKKRSVCLFRKYIEDRDSGTLFSTQSRHSSTSVMREFPNLFSFFFFFFFSLPRRVYIYTNKLKNSP